MTSSVAQRSNVQVLHMSLPRTGSFSMKAAYEELGMPTYHGFVYIERPQDHLRWFDAVQAKYYGKGKPFTTEDFDDLVGEWAVVSDNPVIGFVEELLQTYPEVSQPYHNPKDRLAYQAIRAKVVLVCRDLDKWYKSYDEGVIRSFFPWKMWAVLNLIEPLQTLKPVTVTRDLQYAIFHCSNQTQWQRNSKLICQEHTEKIRELVPKERLLEYKLGSGWEPFHGNDIRSFFGSSPSSQ
ncbi:uncharacterized protein CCOS01_16568 [Colletotrichum costaricense]|uniref:Sulfotransferase family protein n=1 Tax=Colletotrichum costaricense TaxID=1209916 RepID=A0AAI9YFF3_9PEZI|nr:uncharacterized protein CCOS01_16568 [Colletotrichum costaricense]KAK1506516.1 hypothetical protein CCOS01_16568 [Colletotrichum costaricense]